ncbi:MAG: cation transporter [Betaproteobacteria bacterium]|nr:cation transporter [Betaproteobacteria bacterium]
MASLDIDTTPPQPATPASPSCCASDRCGETARGSIGSPGRAGLIRQAFRLEWLTVAWMVVEAVVAVASGLAAGSVLLLAFGLDSFIELASAGVLIWRLSVELRDGQAFSERAERLASRIGGGLLFALSAYIVVSAGWSLWTHHRATFSTPGLVISVLAIPIMRYLAQRKISLAENLGSKAMRADAMESITCGWLSLVVVIGLIAQLALGAWWVDAVGSLAIVWFLIKEGREAWAGEDCGCG